MTAVIAACTEVGIPVLGGFAFVLIAGFMSSLPSFLRKFSLVNKEFKISFCRADMHSRH